jgi:hypothetical protein
MSDLTLREALIGFGIASTMFTAVWAGLGLATAAARAERERREDELEAARADLERIEVERLWSEIVDRLEWESDG